MAAKPAIRTRHSIQELSVNPDLQGELEKVVKAWAGIQALPPNDPNSFYQLGGFHGEPFRGPVKLYAGPTDDSNVATKLWWGGYCNHGNVLFPTWHRAYLHRIERAMQSIEGCSDVVLPFWDECFEMGDWNPYNPPPDKPITVIPTVIPTILTDEFVNIDGKRQKNPLRSYLLQRNTSYSLKDQEKTNYRYSKPEGYETCRFPKRGIVCNAEEKKFSDEWNESYKIQSESDQILNVNVAQWLEGKIRIPAEMDDKGNPIIPGPIKDIKSVYSRFQLCLQAPNYTVFSNNTSSAQWIQDVPKDEAWRRDNIVSLESPHNSMHLAIGGFFQPGVYNMDPEQYQHANGDMGDNETASFDPIFFFHHAFIDYAFWKWQEKHGLTKRGSLEVLDDYPGTITDEGSPIGLAPGSMLDMDTPLYPFRPASKKGWVTSHDVTDIHELGYTYGKGSLDPYAAPIGDAVPTFAMVGEKKDSIDSKIVDYLRVSGINRAEIRGSFVIRTVAKHGDKIIEIGREAILSRTNVRGCANCQTHLEAEAFTPVYSSLLETLGVKSPEEITYEVLLDTHDTTWAVPVNVPLGVVDTIGDLEKDGALKGAKSVVRIESF